MKKIYVIAINLGYWLSLVLLLAILFIATRIGTVNGSLVINLYVLIGGYILIPSLISFYGSYFILFKLFVQKTNKGKLVLFSLSLLVISSLIALVNISSLIDTPQVLLEIGLVSLLLNSFNALVGFILHSFISWFTDLKKKEELRQKTETLELEMLKLKLDPHFLFNTINNIDVLIETDPKKASEYIVKLSSVLRFYLYKTSDSMIQLSDEIKYIQEYVDLQKIRTTNQNFINLTIEGVSGAKKIFPMVFIPFIENAFKHSQNKKTDAINIQISILENEVHFKCINKLKRTATGTKGIGNLLIEKRLKLIYGDTYELNVKTSEVDYAIELKIPV
tara:strand:- start:11592 stop:12593 length:1002 start_codon:yes stop_codon:yes gene_type:complete